jgi:hypothetical protein
VNASTTFALPPTMSGANITAGTIPLTSIRLATTTMTAPTSKQIGYTISESRDFIGNNLARRNMASITLTGPKGSIWIISFTGTFTINGVGDGYDASIEEGCPLSYYIGIDNSLTGPFASSYFTGYGRSSGHAVHTLQNNNQNIIIYLENSVPGDYLRYVTVRATRIA